jgi:hypothetical protein
VVVDRWPILNSAETRHDAERENEDYKNVGVFYTISQEISF